MKPFREALKAPSSALQNLFSTVCLGMCLLLVVHYINTTSVNLQSAAVVLRKGTEPRKRLTSTTTSTTNTTSNSVAASSATTSRPGSTCAHRVMSVVSGYINIGTFKKGTSHVHSRKDYANWVQPLRLIKNPLVFYSDDAEMLKLVRKLRAEHQLLGCTHTQLLNRSELWGFKLVDNISRVINRTDYPKLYPNTVVPEYAAVMHAKFDMLQLTLQSNPFDTEMIAWMDSGLFRNEKTMDQPIVLLPPNGFNKNLVAVNQVAQPNFDLKLSEIFLSDLKWYVGGGYFLATNSVMQQWCEQYRLFTEYFLRLNLSNSDQQVIYGMYTKEVAARTDADKPPLRVRLQRYAPWEPVIGGSWYHLRWLSQDEGNRWSTRESAFANWTADVPGARTPMWYMRRYLDSLERHEAATGSDTLQKLERVRECNYNATVVTAYFSFGTISARAHSASEQKQADGSEDELWLVRDSDVYSKWLASLAKVSHPVVAYFDCEIMRGRFQQSRKLAGLDKCTRAQLIKRNSLWSWHAQVWIDQLQQSASNSNANSTRLGTEDERSTPEYLAARHSKYALLQKATEVNPFNTSDFVWLDPVQLSSGSTAKFAVQRAPNAVADSESLELRFERRSEGHTMSQSASGSTEPTASATAVTVTVTSLGTSSVTANTTNVHGIAIGTGASASGKEACVAVLSTGFLAGNTLVMHAFSAAYRLAAEFSLARQLVLSDSQVLEALYCWPDLQSVVETRLRGSLPPLVLPRPQVFVQARP